MSFASKYRWGFGCKLLALVVIVLVLVPTFPTGILVVPSGDVHSPHQPVGQREMMEATASLKKGQGPLEGGGVSCSPLPGGSTDCEAGPVSSFSTSGSATWTQLRPPSPRSDASMAYDNKDGYVLLFGGLDPALRPLGDAWMFSAGVWKDITTFPLPSPRSGASMVYDAADGYVLLFGGASFSSTFLGDTWKFAGGSWTPLNIPATSSPSARAGASMAYDAADGYLLLFGGRGFGVLLVLGDTWKFSGGSWTSLTAASSPSARSDASMVFDSADGYVVLFGGEVPMLLTSTFLDDTWKFVGGSWTNLNIPSPTSPSARAGAGVAFDFKDGYLVLFGGTGRFLSTQGDTWKFSAGAWNDITFVPSPSARAGASMAYDAADGYLLLFGGVSFSSTFLGDSWKFSGGVWTNITSTPSPSPRSGASMVYDAADGYVLLFGGSNLSGALGDTWSFSAGVWTPLNIRAASSPSARSDASMVFDSADGYVVLFGGEVSMLPTTFFLVDTWKFSGGVWTNITPTFTPSPLPRFDASMAFDAADGYILLFGGVGLGPTYLGDTWKFVGGSWTPLNIPATSSPSARAGASMAYDAADGYLLLFGGVSDGPTFFGDTWKFSGGVWTNITSTPSPSPRFDAGMAYDVADGQVVLFGGESTVILGDTWTWRLSVSAFSVMVSAMPTGGPAPLAVSFQAIPFGGTPGYVWIWSFGDGSTSMVQNSAHVYSSLATFRVTLIATDSKGAVATASLLITVNPSPLSASAFASPAVGTAPLTVYFTGSASGGTPPYSYLWSLGDGSTSMAQNPSHQYTQAGLYTATLTVKDQASVTASSSFVINVQDFTLSSSPASITLVAGSSASSTITVAGFNGFAGTVSLAATGTPAGCTVTLDPTNVFLGSLDVGGIVTSAPSTLRVSCFSGAAFTVTITGTSRTLLHTTTVTLTAQDFTVTPSPASLTTPVGTAASSTVTVAGLYGFSGVVSLTATSSASLTVGLSSNSVTGAGTSTLTVSGTTIGSYTITVTGSSGSLSHSVMIPLTVTSAPSQAAPQQGPQPWQLYLIMAAVLAAGAIIALLLVRRRRPRPSAQP